MFLIYISLVYSVANSFAGEKPFVVFPSKTYYFDEGFDLERFNRAEAHTAVELSGSKKVTVVYTTRERTALVHYENDLRRQVSLKVDDLHQIPFFSPTLFKYKAGDDAFYYGPDPAEKGFKWARAQIASPVRVLGQLRDGRVVAQLGNSTPFLLKEKYLGKRVPSAQPSIYIGEVQYREGFEAVMPDGKVGTIAGLYDNGIAQVASEGFNRTYELDEITPLEEDTVYFYRPILSATWGRFEKGTRVFHSKLGAGTVVRVFKCGRAQVSYDNAANNDKGNNSYLKISSLTLLNLNKSAPELNPDSGDWQPLSLSPVVSPPAALQTNDQRCAGIR